MPACSRAVAPAPPESFLPVSQRTIRFIVTDLENTLYDWLTPLHRRIHTLIAGTIQATGLDQSTIEAMLGALHRRVGTSEPARPLDLEPVLRARIPPAERDRMHAGCDRAASAALALYPGVDAALAALREAGIGVIGYTESAPGPTAQRLHQLDLDRALDRVICLQPNPPSTPPGIPAASLRIAPTGARVVHGSFAHHRALMHSVL